NPPGTAGASSQAASRREDAELHLRFGQRWPVDGLHRRVGQHDRCGDRPGATVVVGDLRGPVGDVVVGDLCGDVAARCGDPGEFVGGVRGEVDLLRDRRGTQWVVVEGDL